MTTSTDTIDPDGFDTAGLLHYLRQEDTTRRRAEVNILRAALAWADAHPALDIHTAASLLEASDPVLLGGEGCPEIAEHAIHEFAACLHKSTMAGKALLSDALSLRHRLPRLWDRVQDLQVEPWKARRIAAATIALPRNAAAYVDRQVAPCADRIGPTALDRLITHAADQHALDHDQLPPQTTPRRDVLLDPNPADTTGTVEMHAWLDPIDAHDLNHTLSQTAAALKTLGSTDDLPTRRAHALGELARQDLTLTYNTDDDGDHGEATTTSETTTSTDTAAAAVVRLPRRRRQAMLYIHINHDTLTNTDTAAGGGYARIEQGNRRVTATAVRDWLTTPDTHITIRPVLDLTEHIHTTNWEAGTRAHELIALRDQTCRFPYCTRPARPHHPDQHPCDADHTTPYHHGGPTCTCQLVPLCRTHHRAKTFTPWRYQTLGPPGHYLWTSPHGYQHTVTPTGTTDHSLDTQWQHRSHTTLTPTPDHPPDWHLTEPPDNPWPLDP